MMCAPGQLCIAAGGKTVGCATSTCGPGVYDCSCFRDQCPANYPVCTKVTPALYQVLCN
jgi:hypothetical protein